VQSEGCVHAGLAVAPRYTGCAGNRLTADRINGYPDAGETETSAIAGKSIPGWTKRIRAAGIKG